MQVKLEDIVAEGDKVACIWTATATHKGEFMDMPATDKRVTMKGIHIDRIADGKIVQTWGLSDALGLMQQLGIGPRPPC
jgi:predicted ester cyclase